LLAQRLISQRIQDKRKILIVTALTTLSIRLKGWQDAWQLYFTAWKRLKDTIESSNNWPWETIQLKLCGQLGDQFTVKKATEFLRQYLIKPTAVQTPIAS
ncbi:7963_t:CDS:1, partial [Gigaspora rosea]